MNPCGRPWYKIDMRSRQELVEAAHKAWNRVRGGGLITENERSTLREAYWASVLPTDPDYSVPQWVEDGMPPLS